MSEILYIEGYKMDLIPDTISRTLQINDIGEAKDRQSNFSNTTGLPLTPNNVKAFKFLGVSGNTSDLPYKKLRCDYILNGIQLIRNGYALVKGTNTHYEVVLYDGIIDLSERIKGKKLNELNFSDLNHYLTSSTFQTSLSNTEGYIYALGEFLPRPSFMVRIQEQAPSLFVKTIWDKIWTEAGLRYSGSFFVENADFQTEVITPEKGYLVENITLTSTDLGTGVTNLISRNVNNNDPALRFTDQHTFTSGNFTGITINPDGSLLISADAQLRLNIDTTFTNVSSWVQLQVLINESTKATIQLPEDGSSVQSVVNLQVKAGDLITFIVTGTYAADYQSDGLGGKYGINYSASSSISITELTGGQFIDFATFTTEMDQATFIKDVMQRYGLLVKPVRNSNIYEFIQFETLLNDKAGAEDWSKKLDVILGEGYDINYAKSNTANYNYPKEIVNKLYDGVLKVPNENASDEKNLFSSPYEITTTRSRKLNGKSIYQVHIWEEKEEDGQMIIVPKETPVKIFRLSKVQATINTYFFDNANAVVVTGNIPFLSLENMEMQYFLNVYYKAFRNLISRAKQIEARMLMNEIDIYNLDFFRLKYFKQTGRFYYLNNLKHSAGEISKAELVELNSFSVNAAPTVLGVYAVTMPYTGTRTITIDNITDQTNPAYFDPEFDEPAAIMITGGFNSNVLIKNGAQILTTQTEILVENWNLQIEDAGNLITAHSAAFTFKIKDAGSGEYSEVEGTIEVNVSAYTNAAPIANAGADKTITIDSSNTALTSYSTALDGSGSSDDTQITSYVWTKISGSGLGVISDTDTSTPSATFVVENQTAAAGVYELQLEVTDEFGATAIDTIVITVNDSATEITP